LFLAEPPYISLLGSWDFNKSERKLLTVNRPGSWDDGLILSRNLLFKLQLFALDHQAVLPSGKQQSMQVKSVSKSAGKIGKARAASKELS
jgi:hypothetical protein